MKKMALAGFLILQCAAASSFAATYNTKAESSATETSGPDGVVQTVANTSFAFTNLYNPQKQGFTDILIAQKIESAATVGREGTTPKLEANAWSGGKGRYDTKMWVINDCADAGWRSGDFYQTSKYGWGGTENLLRAYNFKTGKYAYSFTTDPVAVDIYIPKDTIKRHVSYVSRKGTDSECRKNEMPKNVIGALTLSDSDAQIDRIVFEAEEEDLGWSPRITLVNEKEPKGVSNMSVWGPAEFINRSEAVKGFSVKLIFRNGMEAVVPVAYDKFDVQRASLPRSIKVRRIDAEKADAVKADAGKP